MSLTRRTLKALFTVRKKRSWSSYWKRAIPIGLIIGGVIVWFAFNYRIGIATQLNVCIPGKRVFLIDLNDQKIVRGGIYQFKAQGITEALGDERLRPFFQDGKLIVKVMEGIPGDVVSVTEAQTTVNNIKVGEGALLAKRLKKEKVFFNKKITLPENKYWFMGKTNDSFDSRYWGTVDEQQIVGRAYAIF